MTRVLAEPAGTLRFRSASGRTELATDPDGYRLHVTAGTDLWTLADVQRLLLALADDLHAAREPAEDAYPHLFAAPASPAVPLYCYDCGAKLAVDPIPYWSESTGVVYLGSSCWRARMLALTKVDDGRCQAPPLPIEHEAMP